MITNKDISILIQGVEKKKGYRESLIKTVLNNFSGCQIVIVDLEANFNSLEPIKKRTFNNAGTEIIHVVGKDPGAIRNKTKDIQVNRQIFGARTGIKFCTRRFIYKIRPEIIFKNSNIINQLNLLSSYNLEDRYLVCDSYTSKDPFSYWPEGKFHLSDWSYLSTREIIEELFSLSLVNDNHLNTDLYLFSPETYVMSSYLIRKAALKREEVTNLNKENYLDILLSNILILSPNELGIDCQYFPYKYPFGVNGYLGLTSDLYKKYYEDKLSIPYPLKVRKRLLPLSLRRNIYKRTKYQIYKFKKNINDWK